MKKIILLGLCSLVIAGCNSTPKTVSVPAETAKITATPVGTVAEKKDSEVVCKMQKVLGSNLKKKVCTTKTKIAENEADTKRIMNEMSMGRTEPLQGQ